MTLGFSTKWPKQIGLLAGQPNFFIYKIWYSLFESAFDSEKEHEELVRLQKLFSDDHVKKFSLAWDGRHLYTSLIKSKKHTIRVGHRWCPGTKIHPVIKNRTKDRFQFAPDMLCVSVQNFEILYFNEIAADTVTVNIADTDKEPIFVCFKLMIDGRTLTFDEMEQLAINDGFDSLAYFLQYFHQDFTGQIIHWTDYKY